MLESVNAYLHSFPMKDGSENMVKSILDAMRTVDRAFFVGNGRYAYYDSAIPIDRGQTISQPSTVARMLMLARLRKGNNVLEVGTGSGWNAALVTYLVKTGKVTSLERIPSLAGKAKENVEKLRKALRKSGKDASWISNLEIRAENIFSKVTLWDDQFNRIIVTAGISRPNQEKWIDNLALGLLKEGGVLVCPRTLGPMSIIRKVGGTLRTRLTMEHYSFVPLL
ncbi:MAG: hypothetical protein DRO99_03735 [Candidatus Aenigmatarchaeota archaeon]|nr:MAG: hypothetical protein DRO99_03735 [Candidatus Aenigmarchaeota archaeon]